MEVLDEPRFVRHRLSVADYGRLAEAGVLAPDARVELIEGEVIDMAPMGTRHRAAVMRMSQLLHEIVGHGAQVSTQLPLRLGDSSQPEPDLALLKPRDDFYASALPTGHDSFLVIEIADTTLAYDVRIKAPLYARHGVPELWVLDLSGGLLRRFRAPHDGAYTDVAALQRPGVQPLPGLPGCSVDLSALL